MAKRGKPYKKLIIRFALSKLKICHSNVINKESLLKIVD